MRFQFVRRLEDDALFLNSERKERFLLRRQKSSRPKTRRKKQTRRAFERWASFKEETRTGAVWQVNP
jgi:hypothetical protein